MSGSVRHSYPREFTNYKLGECLHFEHTKSTIRFFTIILKPIVWSPRPPNLILKSQLDSREVSGDFLAHVQKVMPHN